MKTCPARTKTAVTPCEEDPIPTSWESMNDQMIRSEWNALTPGRGYCSNYKQNRLTFHFLLLCSSDKRMREMKSCPAWKPCKVIATIFDSLTGTFKNYEISPRLLVQPLNVQSQWCCHSVSPWWPVSRLEVRGMDLDKHTQHKYSHLSASHFTSEDFTHITTSRDSRFPKAHLWTLFLELY